MTDMTTSELIDALSKCRDAFPIPEQGSNLEGYWASAMGDPLSVPGYVQQSLNESNNIAQAMTQRTEVDSTALQEALGLLRTGEHHDLADRLEETAYRLVDSHKTMSNITATVGRTTNFSLTERKTNGILEKGYKLTGYVLQKEETGERAIIESSVVRWLNKAAMFDLMHRS